MSELYNYMETLVNQYLDEALERPTEANLRIKQDKAMRTRVLVQVLNHVPPFYVTGKVGEVFGFSNAALSQNKADIMVEIAKAIEVETAKEYN